MTIHLSACFPFDFLIIYLSCSYFYLRLSLTRGLGELFLDAIFLEGYFYFDFYRDFYLDFYLDF